MSDMESVESLSNDRMQEGKADSRSSSDGPVETLNFQVDSIDTNCHKAIDDGGCPLASTLHNRLKFETFLSELSAKFVNVPADQVDAEIAWGLRQIVELFGIDWSGLGEVTADGQHFVVKHAYQLPGIPSWINLILDEHLPVYVSMIRQGRVVRLPDDLPEDAVAERMHLEKAELQSNLTIPLIVLEKVVGAIGFSSYRSPFVLPDEMIPRLRLVGDVFTNALARKRADETLAEQEQMLLHAREGLRHLTSRLLISQEEERARIAREMHDDWTQRLAVLGIEAAGLEGRVQSCEDALPLVRAIRQGLVGLAEDVHSLSRQLHPSIIEDLGLAEALRSECASFAKRELITVDYQPEDIPNTISKDVSLCIYRVAQECLRNVAKHAAVNKVSVSLELIDDELVLSVCDRGVGFDPDAVRMQAAVGIDSMEERVHLVDGRLEIRSQPGNGTVVEVRIPLKDRHHA